MEALDASEPGPHDATNAEFWRRIAKQAHEASVFRPPDEWMHYDLSEDDLEVDPEWQAREEARRSATREHPLMRLAEKYRTKTQSWLKAADSDLKSVARD
jgi:hypothetical protein